MVEKCRKFSQTELDPETPQSTKSLSFAKLLVSLFVAKSKVTFYQLSMCVKMKVAQSCPTVCDPVDYTVYGILQANSGIEPRSPTVQADSLPAESPGKPLI